MGYGLWVMGYGLWVMGYFVCSVFLVVIIALLNILSKDSVSDC